MEEKQKFERDTGIARLMETGKLWYLERFVSTKLDFGLEFTFQIARQALEQRLLDELEEKDETFFTGADVTLDLCALEKKQNFEKKFFLIESGNGWTSKQTRQKTFKLKN